MTRSDVLRRVRYFLQRADGFVERLRIESEGANITLNQANHPERLACVPYCKGVGIDVGCGSNKTTPDCIGVDLTPGGALGAVGNQRRAASAADIAASGDDLPMFNDGQLDFVISRHNLEHYTDPIRALAEWKRILRHGGHIVVITPDDRFVDAIHLDPSHKHAFTPESFRRIVGLMGGLEIEKLEPCIPNWSFICVLRRA